MKYQVSITDVAVIGMTCRFPKAKNTQEYFENIKEGKSCIEFFDKESFNNLGIYEKGLESNYIPAAGVINEIEFFDADFFGITPSEASLMDPQHRLLLECAYEALESSGYISNNSSLAIGVYASCSRNTYLLSNILQNSKITSSAGMYPLMIGNQNDFVSTRISYKLGLTGPAITLQTACSSSLVAVNYACQDLILRNSDISLVGASTIHVPNYTGYNYEESGILSKHGECLPFDKDSSGTVPGNGVGVLILKRLKDAMDDNDKIYALIKGTKVNNDGNQKIGYTAPGINGQEKVIRECMQFANVKPEQISLVEAHGTGTRIGDPIEMSALKKAFNNTTKESSCAISSVKSQIGHLDATAGIAGLIKVILCLDGNVIPPVPYLTELNPHISLNKSPFYFPASKKEWKAEPGQWRYAGVSSFGVGGTNSHAILMEAPPAIKKTKTTMPQVFIFSARNQQALSDLLASNIEWLHTNPEENLQDISYTLWMGRNHFQKFRTFAIGNDIYEIISQLSENQNKHHNRKNQVFIDFCSYSTPEIIQAGRQLCNSYLSLRREIEHLLIPTVITANDFIDGTDNKNLVSLVVLMGICGFMRAMGINISIANNGVVSKLLLENIDNSTISEGIHKSLQSYCTTISREDILDSHENSIVISHDIIFDQTPNTIQTIDLFSQGNAVNGLLMIIGTLWSSGSPIVGKHLFNVKQCGFIPLPTYAFQRNKYWIEAEVREPNTQIKSAEPAVETKQSMDVIIGIWKDILGVKEIKPEDDFFELGGDSLMAIQFISRIKEAYNVVLNVNELLETTSASEVDQLLKSKFNKRADSPGIRLFSPQPLLQLKKGNKGVPLILFHPAGGTVYCYNELLRQMNITSDVYGIQFPLEMLKENVKKVPELAKHYMNLFMAQVPSKAYYLAGYSLGGNIAFEIATLLQSQDKADVKGLYLIDSHAPAAYKGELENSNELISCFPYVLSSFLNIQYETGQNTPDLDAMYLQLKAKNLIPEQFEHKEFELLFNVWKYNHLSLRDYDHALKYNSDVVIFKAEEEESEAFLKKLQITRVEKEEWLKYINGNLEIINVPGNHMTMLSNPHVQTLSRAFSKCYNHVSEVVENVHA